MNNKIIPEAEIKMVESVLKQVDELQKLHGILKPNMSNLDNRLERVHSILYLELLKDFVNSAKMLEAMLKISEESLMNIITDEGKIPFDVAEMKVLMTALSKIEERI